MVGLRFCNRHAILCTTCHMENPISSVFWGHFAHNSFNIAIVWIQCLNMHHASCVIPIINTAHQTLEKDIHTFHIIYQKHNNIGFYGYHSAALLSVLKWHTVTWREQLTVNNLEEHCVSKPYDTFMHYWYHLDIL